MQRILLSLCTGTLLLFVQPKAQAQEQQTSTFKRNLIGGSFSFNTSKTKGTAPDGGDSKGTEVGTFITYVHYIKERVGLGVQASYLHTERNYPVFNLPDSKSNIYFFSPFVRLDIPLWESRFSIFNDLGINGAYSRSNDQYPNDKVVTESWGLGAFYTPGIMFLLKSNISLQLSYGQLLSYNYSRSGGTTSHSAGLRSGSTIENIQFGVNFLF
jgi:hypothetical protein